MYKAQSRAVSGRHHTIRYLQSTHHTPHKSMSNRLSWLSVSSSHYKLPYYHYHTTMQGHTHSHTHSHTHTHVSLHVGLIFHHNRNTNYGIPGATVGKQGVLHLESNSYCPSTDITSVALNRTHKMALKAIQMYMQILYSQALFSNAIRKWKPLWAGLGTSAFLQPTH